MRKIEEQLTKAIQAGESFRSGSTSYDPRTGTVVLYSTAIAQREGSGWKFNLGGFNTATTRSRLNAIATAEGLNPVGTCRGEPYVRAFDRKVPVPTDGWFFP